MSRSSGGRSAVRTISGTRASRASIDARAGSAAAAVPHVQASGDRAPGRLRQAEREEAGAALVDVRRSTAGARRARATSTSGVEREPGDVHAPAIAAARELVDERAQQQVGVGGVGQRWAGAMAETVVLLHGFAGTGRAWDRVAERLDPERYRPLAPDLRGHGDGRATRGRSRSPRASADVARRGARALRARAATRWAAGSRCTSRSRAPERVARLVLVATTAGHRGPRRARRAPRGRRASSPPTSSAATIEAFADRWAASRCSPATPPQARARSGAPTCCATTRRRSPPRCAGSAPGRWRRCGTGSASCAMPVTVVVGERDAKFTALGRRLAARAARRASSLRRPGRRPRPAARGAGGGRGGDRDGDARRASDAEARARRARRSRRRATGEDRRARPRTARASPSPHGARSARSAAAQCTRGGDAERAVEASRRGRPRRPTRARARPAASSPEMPPQRDDLQADGVGDAPRVERARLGGGLVHRDAHRDAVAHRAQRLDAVHRLLDELEPGGRERLDRARPPRRRSQAPLASRRSAISGPAAARTAATRPASSPMPTLTFTQRSPPRAAAAAGRGRAGAVLGARSSR